MTYLCQCRSILLGLLLCMSTSLASAQRATSTKASTAVKVGGAAVDLALFIKLDWKAPDECPSREDVLREAARMIRSPDELSSEHVRARGTLVKRGDKYALSLRTQQGKARGRRALEGESCEALSQVAAFILALALDPSAQMPAPPEPEPEPEPESKPEPILETTPGPWKETHFYVGLGPVVQLGVLPALSGGGVLYAGYQRGIWQFTLRGLGFGPRKSDPIGMDAVVSKFFNWGVGVETATLFRFKRWRFGPLVGLLAGAVQGSTDAIDVPGSTRSAWWEIYGGLRTRYHFSHRWALSTQVEVGVPFRRPRFFVQGVGEAHQASSLLGRLQLSAEIHF